MINFKKIGMLIVLLVTSSVAFAGLADGLYAGLGVATVENKHLCNHAPACDDTDTTWNVFGGYSINENLAAEITYVDLGDFSLGALDGDADAWELAGLLKLPMSDSFGVYARVGIAAVEVNTNFSSSDTSNSQPVWGVGADLKVNEKIGARLDYRVYNSIGDKATTGEYDIDMLELAATYSF